MKKNNIPKKICPICLCTFEPNSYNQKFCHDCFENHYDEVRDYRAKEREKRLDTYNKNRGHAGIHNMNAEIEKYNKTHGTHLTYGKYVHAKAYGLLED